MMRAERLFTLVFLMGLVLAAAHVPTQVVSSASGNEVACDADDLIAALDAANASGGATTLELAAGCTYTLTEVDNLTDGPNGLPSITGEITVNGNRATITRDGAPFLRVLHVAKTGNLTLHQVTVRGGMTDHDPGGNGIANWGTLALIDSTLTGNYAPVRAFSGGGGLYNAAGASATVVKSRITANRLDQYGCCGGGIDNDGTMAVIDSTVSDNYGGRYGGGIANAGTLEIVNSTLSGNLAYMYWGGGSMGTGGGIGNVGTLTVRNSTISDNRTGGLGAGLEASSGGTVILQSTILVRNDAQECSGVITSQGYNLARDDTCGLVLPTDQVSVSPLIGPLQDNGGPTKTHALLPDSPAIDRGSCPQALADQRGLPRHVDVPGIGRAGDACDVGAYELQDGALLGGVIGTVTSAFTRRPLAATLALLPTDQKTTSDPESGAYGLWSSPGNYTLQVSAPDYLTQTLPVELSAQAPSTQDFALRLESEPEHIFLPLVMR